ncbi:transcription factor E2F7-like isoform X1 [Mobula hypostoma]|uniref:transcription factor E2F7-like isoform X1 n=1 Tax=Mobula hypostoma TaxID=723540 RepID=UPI002FC308AD
MECLKLKDLRGKRIGKCDVAPNTVNDEAHSAQKENWFRSSPKTPVKTELAPSAVSRRKCCTPDRVQVTPSKLPDKSPPEPWSPTANLRMLISAASPDIRDREKKKELFRQIENERVESAGDVIQLVAVDDGATDEFEQQRPSRKQKSLGLLCQKFLARYPNNPISTEKTEISLDEVATELGVERRRIYDIVNVLESLQLVSRVAKNQYSWHGLLGLGQTLAVLKRRGEQLGYVEQLAHVRHRDLELELELDADGEERRDAPQENWGGCQEPAGDSPSPEPKSKSVSMNSRKDKSLRIMSEKFVMLFLVAEPRTIALDAAAKILIEEGQPEAVDSSKFKTKIRRLYDIANVLTSLGLIKKVHVNERGRKPVFQWVGPVCRDQPDARALDAVGSSGKMAQLVAACKLQFEEDNKNSESRPRGGVSQPEAAPLVVASSIASLAKLPAPSDQLWTSCLPVKGSAVPQSTAPGSDEGCPIFHRGQPFVLLQSLPSTPVLVMYGNVDASSESRPSEQGGVSPLGCREQRAGSCRKRSPAQQHSFPYGQGQDSEPYTKRQKAHGSIECESAGNLASVQSADKETPLRHGALGGSSEGSTVVTGTSAQSAARELAFRSVSMGAQEEEKPDHSKTLENGSSAPPRVNDGNQEPPSSRVPKSFLTGSQSGLPENGPCYCLPAASGLSDVNLLLSAAPGRGGFAIPLGHLAPTTLPYQVMLPVLLPTTTSAGGSLLPGLSLLPAAQIVMGGDPVSPPASPTAGSPTQERQVYSATIAPSSRESPPSKTETSAVQPVTVLKLQSQSPVAVAASDVQQASMETYFHTPVPVLQGKQLQGAQVKTASPAQRKLEIENSLAK